ncbi:MAG: plasmid replication protein, CyRepA1 family, partial [Chloroflexota bacterium]
VDDADFEQTPQGLIDILASRLGVMGWKSNGWASKNISSPFRDDRHPSATFNRESGVLHDFGTGESYSPTQVAEQLGIDWKAFYPKRNISTKAPRPRLDATSDTNVNSVTIPPFEADKIVDMRYISDIDLGELGDTNLIRSPLATGKTSLISKIIANANDNAKILVITHLQALAENISERLSQELDKPVECYHHIPHEYRPSAYRLVCSYDSLHTIRDDWDYVFIDEHEQFHRHLTSGTMRGNEPVRAYKKLLTIIEGAQHLTVMDAHMSVASTHFLKFFRGKLTRIKNTYRHKWQTMTFHQKESKVLAEAFKEASKDSTHGVVIPTNSRSKSQDYYQLACETFGDDAVMLINGENSSSKDARQFIRQLTDPRNKNKSLAEIFPNLRILICSPSLATGLDVQARVSGVYGIFTQQKWVNACNIMQMMMRYRNADDRHLCVMGSNLIPEPRTNPEDFVDSEYFAMNTPLDGTTIAADFGKHGVPFSNYMQEYIAIFSAWFEYETHYQQQSLRYFTELSAQDEGFTVAYQEGEDVIIREQLKWAREQRAEAFKQAVLSETVVSPDEFDTLRQHPDTTSKQLRKATAGIERWHIEFVSGQTVTAQLFAHLGSTRKRADFNRLLDLLDNVENLKKRDRDEAINDILVIKRKHYTRNRDLIYMAGRCVFGEDWLTNEQQATAETITERLETYMRLYIEEIRQYIDRRLDLSSKALNVFRRLLKRIGLQLGRAQMMVDGERFYMYFIDGEHREEMLAIATIGLQARDLRELLQTRTTLINIREWSKQQSDDSVYERWQAQFADIPI